MTIAIGPKNEASTLKSLKLAKIKDFFKIMSFQSTLMDYLVSGHIFDGTLPFSGRKLKKTTGECSICILSQKKYNFLEKSLAPLKPFKNFDQA